MRNMKLVWVVLRVLFERNRRDILRKGDVGVTYDISAGERVTDGMPVVHIMFITNRGRLEGDWRPEDARRLAGSLHDGADVAEASTAMRWP